MNSNEFFEALTMLGAEKGIEEDYLLEKIRLAVLNAVKRDYNATDNAIVEVDMQKRTFDVSLRKEVVEEVLEDFKEILIDEAREIKPAAIIGDFVDIPLHTREFGRIAAQAAKHMIRQGIREAERDKMLVEFQNKEHEILSASVSRIDPIRGNVSLLIGESEAVLPKIEQIPGEEFIDGQKVKIYVVDVSTTEKGPKIIISRTHSGFVKRLFEMEVPEIYEGVVLINAISREAGSRTKIAVSSKDENVDPVGSCIGAKGIRVNSIIEELNGEKIDVIPYSENPEEFIAAALAPADVIKVNILDAEERTCRVMVPDHQLSLAIGGKGQNARLAARLTEYKIDIYSESDYEDPEEVVAEKSEEVVAEKSEEVVAEKSEEVVAEKSEEVVTEKSEKEEEEEVTEED